MISLILSSLLLAAITALPPQATYVITGQVQDTNGKAAGCVRVCAFAADFDSNQPNVHIPCALSDERGRVVIGLDKPGKYRLFYDHSAQGYWSSHLPFFRQSSALIPEVILDEINTRASITIFLAPKNGLLVGKSVDATNGAPVESMDLIMCHAASPEICWGTSAKNSDGKFTVPAPHVPFTLRVRADGFDDWLGLNGEDREAAISIASESKTELNVFLKRRAEAAGKAISESEKQDGVHLPAPVQLSPADQAVFDHYPRQTKLQWSPVEGAVSYTVEVDHCAGGVRNRQGCINPQPLMLKTNPQPSRISATAYEFNFIGMQPGRWRVWAVDKDGREGFKSTWRRFIYLK